MITYLSEFDPSDRYKTVVPNPPIPNSDDKGRYYVGKDVRIVGGSEMGLMGKIVEVLGGGNYLVLKHSRSEEEVTSTVRISDVTDLGSAEEELKYLKIGGSKEEEGVSDWLRSCPEGFIYGGLLNKKDMETETALIWDADRHELIYVRLEPEFPWF